MSGPDLARQNRLTREVVGWLGTPDPARIAAVAATWRDADVQAVQQLLFTQGLGPFLYDLISNFRGAAPLPAALQAWLHAEYLGNARRMEVMHGEFADLLAGANRLSIAVAPLKGLVLSLRYYRAPALRPMADLDLLVRPEDEPGMTEVLQAQGYRLTAGDPRAHRTFLKPDQRVVAWTQDHPDNPRPVELHTQLKRRLWLERFSHDFTDYLWSESRESEFLGQRAWLPSDEALLTDLAQHATRHALARSGRALHWLDLAQVAPRIRRFAPPSADWTYPALRLAARAFPSAFEAFPFEALAERTSPRLRHLAETVPLDERAGINVRAIQAVNLKLGKLLWFWWKPTPWRVTLSFPKLPPALAYPAYAGAVSLHLTRRLAQRLSR